MKQLRQLGVTLILGMTLVGTAHADPFADVTSNDLYYNAVEFFAENGIIEGYAGPDGTRLFKPDQKVNRAEAVKLVIAGSIRNLSIPSSVQDSYFSDIPTSAWYARYVVAAKNAGIVSGDGATGQFLGERSVNKAELMKMLVKTNQIPAELKIKNINVLTAPDVAGSDWFYDYMTYGKEYGIVTPDNAGNLFPAKELTRGDVALMLYNIYNIVRNGEPQEYLSRTEAKLMSAIALSNTKRFNDASIEISSALATIKEGVSRFGDEHEIMEKAETVTEGTAELLEAYEALRSGDEATAKQKAERALNIIAPVRGLDKLTTKISEVINELLSSLS